MNYNPWSFGYNTGTATYYGQQPDYLTGQPSYNPYGGLYTGVPATMQYGANQYSLYHQGNNYGWMGQNARNPYAENIASQYIGHQSVAMAAGAQPGLGSIYDNPYTHAGIAYTFGTLHPNSPYYAHFQQKDLQYKQQLAQAEIDADNIYAAHGITNMHNIVMQSGGSPQQFDFQPSHHITQTIGGNSSHFGNFMNGFIGGDLW